MSVADENNQTGKERNTYNLHRFVHASMRTSAPSLSMPLLSFTHKTLNAQNTQQALQATWTLEHPLFQGAGPFIGLLGAVFVRDASFVRFGHFLRGGWAVCFARFEHFMRRPSGSPSPVTVLRRPHGDDLASIRQWPRSRFSWGELHGTVLTKLTAWKADGEAHGHEICVAICPSYHTHAPWIYRPLAVADMAESLADLYLPLCGSYQGAGQINGLQPYQIRLATCKGFI